MGVRFFWDFYGPRAEQTATHFERHLLEFLSKHALVLPCRVNEESEGHWSVSCDPPDVPAALATTDSKATPNGEQAVTVADKLGQALRPQRLEEIPRLEEI